MDSDPDSGQFLGLRPRAYATTSAQLKSFKPPPLTPLLLLLLTSLLLIAAADASSKHRFLIGKKVNSDNSTSPPPPVKDSPVAIPPPPVAEDLKNQTLSPPPLDAPNSKNNTKLIPTSPVEKPKENPAPKIDEKPKEKPNEDPNGSASPPPPESKSKGGNESNVPTAGEGSCVGVSITCRNEDMVACITSFDGKSTEAVVGVQNLRNSTLTASLSAKNSTVLKIRKHRFKKITLDMGQSNKILVKAGDKECVLQMESFVTEGNFPMRFPSYEKLVTPINGAYLLIVTMIIFGGMWACCLVRRRRQRTGGGVPYQELEMALPESTSATEVVTAEGWDQDWDDNWDGDNAVKSPAGHQSISANGLTARSSNKDGWENNWDD